MRLSRIVASILLLSAFLGAPYAHALSSVQGAINPDGTAKFSDPDEKQPPFMMTSPDYPDPSSSAQSHSFSNGPVTLGFGAMGGTTTQGGDDFDRAYNRMHQ